MGATNEPMDPRLLGEWEDPDAKDKEKGQPALIVSEILGKNRYKIVLFDPKKNVEFEGYRVDLPFPEILEVRPIEPAGDGYYLCVYAIEKGTIKVVAVDPPPEGKSASRDELKRYVVQVIGEQKVDRLTGLLSLNRVSRFATSEETKLIQNLIEKAEQGEAAAQDLGVRYGKGEGVRKDEAEAVKWFRKAADQGYTSAQDNLGLCYSNGRGAAKDEAEAVKWYRKAAEQGQADAQNKLGGMYMWTPAEGPLPQLTIRTRKGQENRINSILSSTRSCIYFVDYDCRAFRDVFLHGLREQRPQ